MSKIVSITLRWTLTLNAISFHKIEQNVTSQMCIFQRICRAYTLYEALANNTLLSSDVFCFTAIHCVLTSY